MEITLLIPDGGYWNDRIYTLHQILETMRNDCTRVAERIQLPDGQSFVWPSKK